LYDANGNEIRQKVEYLRPHTSSMRQVTGGNLYGETIGDDLNSLIEKVSSTYDGFNRLKTMEKVKAGTRVMVDYVYNGDGLRIQKTVKSSEEGYAAKVTNYFYDRQHVILETEANGQVPNRYIRGLNYIARMDNTNRLSYYLFNGHGDVVQTVTETGVIENQYDYDIFGNPILTIEIEYKSAIRYAGEFYDEETGLYYLRARYYNPYTGRFISEDSYWGEDANPLSLNLYTYAHNNPIKFVDPSGHNAEEIDRLIREIDKQREIWRTEEEQGAGKNQKEWTEAQDKAHNKANELRKKLAELERGNQQVEDLVKQKGKTDAVDWEEYKQDLLDRRIDEKEQRKETVTPQERYEYEKAKAKVEVAKDQGIGVVDRFDNKAVDRELDKILIEEYGISFTVTEDNDIVFKDSGATWNYVGRDIQADIKKKEQTKSHLENAALHWALTEASSNVLENKKLALNAEQLLILAIFDPFGVKEHSSSQGNGWVNCGGSLQDFPCKTVDTHLSHFANGNMELIPFFLQGA
jgi:RHS repeat-associated protein